MKKSVLEIYAMSVCFATVVCLLITLGIASYNVIQILNPEFTLSSYEYNRYQTNDSFWEGGPSSYRVDRNENQRPSEEALTQKRLESYQRAMAGEARDGFQSLVKSIIVIVLDIVFLGIHWRIARRAREANV